MTDRFYIITSENPILFNANMPTIRSFIYMPEDRKIAYFNKFDKMLKQFYSIESKYYNKYLKYKNKYLSLKKIKGSN
jgi:hypothetical protein